ncbi:hypothetical protein psyc5s11_29980 [Clostridium gelidum]|uniref:Uncharacterized protein n=1 Tax=Clostridium gelidum TaxID=704125 RepID=A0ABM7TCV4_9CLOT|nr:hypothetical protein [Clostridium gelidum]BCZ46931.1 hypothetical protein psyc5s11_29980 [Clostridium gelidum]
MGNYFKDFMQPVKTIFDRLDQQKNKRVIINGNDGSRSGTDVVLPFYPDLPEYPCKLIRGADGKVTEIQYGEDPRGYIWRQILHRYPDGKVDYIKQENPDGSFDIVLTRNIDNKVEIINID